MVGLATVGVVVAGAVLAVLLHRWKEVSSRSRQAANVVLERFGLEPDLRSTSVADAVRQAQHLLFREVGRSRLPDGRYTGGHYVVHFHPDVWAVVAPRLDLVRRQLVDSILADTDLQPDSISVVLRCALAASSPVEVQESLLPPLTKPLVPVEPAAATSSPIEAASARLVLEGEGGTPVARLVDGQMVVLGRSAPATVRVADARVSETHASLVARGDHAEITDLGSRNGTHVNDTEVRGTARLFDGDLLRVGTTTLKLVDLAAQALPLPTAGVTEVAAAEPSPAGHGRAGAPVAAGAGRSPLDRPARTAAPVLTGAAAAPDAAAPDAAAPATAAVVPAVSASAVFTAVDERSEPTLAVFEARPVAASPASNDRAGTGRVIGARPLELPGPRTEPLAWSLRPGPSASRALPVMLGWDDGGPIPFGGLTDPTSAGNGHLVLYGAPGMGKSQGLRSVVAQARGAGITTVALDQAGDFVDLPGLRVERPWSGMDRNPLCPPDGTPGIERAKVEIVDALASAVASRASRMGHRQAAKLSTALDAVYSAAALEDRWPTLRDLHDNLDADLRGIIGEVTGRDLFRSGGPLGDILGDDVVVDLSEVPGVGTLQRLVTGLVLAALDSRIATLPPAPGHVRHLVVIDEANRVKGFASIERLLREGRKAGVAVALSTQHPQDLPEVAHAIVGTTVCLRLGARAASVAAAHLDPGDPGLAERITRLEPGMAFIKTAGQPLRRARLVQHRLDGDGTGAGPAVAS